VHASRTWGGDSFDVSRGVAVATDGNIYITGDTGNSAFLVKFFPVVGVPAAGVAIPAGSETFAGSSDAFLLRVQP
jgi:hypothetical protein